MTSGFAQGSLIDLPSTRRRAQVVRFIGEGSQGAVYEVAVGASQQHQALKWYFSSSTHAGQRAAIEGLIERGAPDARFLWPTEIATLPGSNAFGYVMPLRDRMSVGLSDLLTGRVDAPFSLVCTLGMELADSFLALHNQGLCYRDISFGNVFFNTRTGRPLICDNDNVGIDGASPSAVLGTRRFMAPEIVRREAAPSIATDLYSLAVLLFYLLMVGHPLVGRRELDYRVWDQRAESELFGREPLFVFDPHDTSNAPVPELHGSVLSNWGLYPEQIHRLFVQAFTVGLTDPVNGRVRESVWRSALSQLRDVVMRCPACAKESFWRADVRGSRCWSCDRVLPDPVRLIVDGRSLVLNSGTTVYGHHVRRDYDFATVVARIIVHPERPNRWGLRNESLESWEVVLPSGERIVAEPGRTVGLLPGTRVQIGPASATIVA
jgi:DNA-binding helix-hairpin-helix protein with protein kinase domain